MRTYADCTTEIMTFWTSPAEQWKLRSDGSLVFEHEQEPRSMPLDGRLFFDSSNVLARDLDDDIAAEGVLSQSGQDIVHGGVVIV